MPGIQIRQLANRCRPNARRRREHAVCDHRMARRISLSAADLDSTLANYGGLGVLEHEHRHALFPPRCGFRLFFQRRRKRTIRNGRCRLRIDSRASVLRRRLYCEAPSDDASGATGWNRRRHEGSNGTRASATACSATTTSCLRRRDGTPAKYTILRNAVLLGNYF